MQQNVPVGGAAHVDLRTDQSQWSFQLVGRVCQECALYVVSFFQPIEREIERFDNRKEFDRKTSRGQSLRYVMRVDACRGGGGGAQRLQYSTQREIDGDGDEGHRSKREFQHFGEPYARGDCPHERREPLADRDLDEIGLRTVHHRIRSDEQRLAAGEERK